MRTKIITLFFMTKAHNKTAKTNKNLRKRVWNDVQFFSPNAKILDYTIFDHYKHYNIFFKPLLCSKEESHSYRFGIKRRMSKWWSVICSGELTHEPLGMDCRIHLQTLVSVLEQYLGKETLERVSDLWKTYGHCLKWTPLLCFWKPCKNKNKHKEIKHT